ncbi:THO complex subunit 4 [Eurytemora carolleeae]|uniref:THO complex subunit 4 n=1 Tax=Eurytemora carolleeae TaxID=1294199 RepID=UPI000C7667E5|nr:THO complex subunit 4 [Eurytemora carolleeae]|eukprot:XP_023337749.1 THO complex subunit 4-like [Eurytemora affinis]
MGDKVDMSLDDIIANDRKSRGGSRGASRGGGGGRYISGRGGRGGSRGGQSPGRRSSFPPRGNNFGGGGYDARRSLPVTTSGPGKLLISNLDYGVSEGDLYELFSEFGNIKMAIVHYDRSGMR